MPRKKTCDEDRIVAEMLPALDEDTLEGHRMPLQGTPIEHRPGLVRSSVGYLHMVFAMFGSARVGQAIR